MTSLPIEYGKAIIAKTEAWNEYQLLIDREHTTAEFDAALEKAAGATNKATEWYHRWQAVGGTSDIESIVAAELEQEKHKALQIVLDVTTQTIAPVATAKIVRLDWQIECDERDADWMQQTNELRNQ